MSESSLSVRYRPTRFSEVLGQPAVVASIQGMISRKKIAPTCLISGPYSSGKTTLARLIALYANCVKPTDEGEPCGECSSCQLVLQLIRGFEGNYSDVTELNAALDRGIDRIRSLGQAATMAPRYNYRIFILDEAHQITEAAFKGALKLLEEPPPRTKFILCTTDPQKVPKEIRSRCQHFKLDRLDSTDIAKKLYRVAKGEGLDSIPDKKLKKLCLLMAQASDGHLRDAYNILENLLNYVEQGGKDLDPKTLERVIEESSSMAPYIIVRRYISALLEGSRSKTFIAIKAVDSPEFFLKSVLGTLHQIIYKWIDSKNLFDKDKYWLLKEIQVPGVQFGRGLIANSSDVEDLLSIYTEAYERVKTYTTESLSVLQIATLRALQITAKWADDED